MTGSRDIKDVILSGAPSIVKRVNIYTQSWDDKVVLDHPGIDYSLVIKTIVDPCHVAASNTRPGSYVFVNEVDINSDGEQLRVPVKVYSTAVGTFKSAYYSPAKSHGTVVWRRGDG